ncbi:peptidylprolyl isomerase [Inhella sp.]|uniref:peptidylprolyl isomerase n=1 Tax=Inhella sp. TaxID=1921806 RepID=UPI0035B2EE2E
MKQVMGKRVALKVAALAAGVLLAGAAVAQTALTVGTTVRVATDKGPIDIQLYDTDAPATVANFLSYVRKNAYTGALFHRSVKNFVIQGGGFSFNDATTPRVTAIPTDPPVNNEFSAARSNVRGAVAMAKLGSNPNSATIQWFVNLANNGAGSTANLDGQNGGFTVFGRVSTPSMITVDALANLPTVDAKNCTTTLGALATALDTLPLAQPLTPVTCANIKAVNVVQMRWAKELPAKATSTDTDRVLNYLEALYPQHIAPASPATQTAQGYTYRYYANTNAHVGSKDGVMYYLVPSISAEIKTLGPLAELLQQAAAAGY